MKDKFPEYYNKPDLDNLWKNCTFVFDTNVFIDLYYDKGTYDEFIEILEKKIPNRIWMPYQVGLEYHNNRVNPIMEKLQIYNNLTGSIKGSANSIKTTIKKISKEEHFIDLDKYIHPDVINKDLVELNKSINKAMKKIEKKPDFFADDKIRNKLDSLFKGKIGDNYPSDKLKKIYAEGKIRYENKIPPGFEDKRYGDLILWFQIMDFAKEKNKSIIFVTGDSKRDWWVTHNKEIIGPNPLPHPSLIKEFSSTNQEFYMYRLSDFLTLSKKYLKAKVKPKTIKTVKEMEKIRDLAKASDNAQLLAMQDVALRAANLMPTANQILAMQELTEKASNSVPTNAQLLAMQDVALRAANLMPTANQILAMQELAQKASQLGLINPSRKEQDEDESIESNEKRVDKEEQNEGKSKKSNEKGLNKNKKDSKN